jgi:hypothetical protein
MMRVSATATNHDLATAYERTDGAIQALDRVEGATDYAGQLRSIRSQLRVALEERDLQACGKCPASKPGAVDFGCRCGKTAEENYVDAVEFARIHD